MSSGATFLSKAISIFRLEVPKRKRPTSINGFLLLIQRRNWRKVRRTLRSPSAGHLCCLVDATGLSALGAAIGYNAPYDIIKNIYDLNPDAVRQPDDFGSLPLHIGCLNGSDPTVVELILSQKDISNDIASHVDRNKHTPLYYATEFFCSAIKNDVKPSKDSSQSQQSKEMSASFPSAWLYINDNFYYERLIQNGTKVIEILCKYAPECTLISNRSGKSPIDLIQEKKLHVSNEANFRYVDNVYQLMNKCAISQYRQQKTEWERNGYESRLPSSIFSLNSSNSSNDNSSIESSVI